MDRETLQQRLGAYKWWQTVELPEGMSTPGNPTVRPVNDKVVEAMRSLSFTGKRVLEIGCRDGLFSFEAERLGAREVIGIDHILSRGAIDLLIPALSSKVQMVELNMFDPRLSTYGKFDIVIFAGVLYHLRYPFWAFKVIRDLLVDGGKMVLETACFQSDDPSPLLYCPSPKDSPYEPTSVTFFNERGIRDALESMGFGVGSLEWVGNKGVPERTQIKNRALQVAAGVTRLLGSLGFRTRFTDEQILGPADARLDRKWIGRVVSVSTAGDASGGADVSTYWDRVPTGREN